MGKASKIKANLSKKKPRLMLPEKFDEGRSYNINGWGWMSGKLLNEYSEAIKIKQNERIL